MSTPAFYRNELLLGKKTADALANARVILFGVGGVGSWCAEALVRSGIGHLTIVDNDVVCVTNINRQLQATASSVGQSKVDTLKKRLLDIAPNADIQALHKVYNLESKHSFDLDSYDYVIDAIDSLANKVSLIALAMEHDVLLYSAMGAANKLDCSQIRSASIWETKNCRLARFVRKRLRRWNTTGECICVYSEEKIEDTLSEADGFESDLSNEVSAPKFDENGVEIPADAWGEKKASVNGSMVHITGSFGFYLAGLVIQDVHAKVV